MLTGTRIRILLADDHPRLLAETARLLGQVHEVIGTVSNGMELIDAANRLDPDVIVLDISMPGLGGFEAARRLIGAGCRSKLVFLTICEDPDMARAAMTLGVNAYVVKSRLVTDLIPAISKAPAEEHFVSPTLAF